MRIVAAMTTEAIGPDRHFGGSLGRVAGVAMQTLMRASQWKARLRGMVEPPRLPTVGGMALRALGAEPAFVLGILVAAVACHLCILEAGRAMALLAGNPGVQSDQREARHVVVEGHLLPPAGFLVALLAARAQLAFVRVIFLVAARAIGGQFVAIEIADVTGVALRGGVFAAQRKLGRLVVIEGNRGPFGGGVAGLALLPVAAGVLVLHGVARDAGRADAFVFLAGVTGRAGDIAMCAHQREFGLGMIERLGRPPALVAVAVLAVFAEAALVRLDGAMATDAGTRGLAELLFRRVTAVTPYRCMGAGQLEVGAHVIERFAVELDDVGAAAFVIGVAVPAIAGHRVAVATVKAACLGAIDRHLLVTVEAQFRLRLARERLVTLAAVRLQLGMALDQGAGHHEFLKNRLGVASRACHQRE